MGGAINVGIDQRDLRLELKMRTTALLSGLERRERLKASSLKSKESDFAFCVVQRLLFSFYLIG
jgi:hypothetical protein